MAMYDVLMLLGGVFWSKKEIGRGKVRERERELNLTSRPSIY